MTNTNGTQTFVSLPAGSVSNFYLQRAGWLAGQFVFDMYEGDSISAPDPHAVSTTIPAANTWYHLTGVYDAAAKLVKVYVNGVKEGQAAAPVGTFANNLPLAFGYSKWNGMRMDGNNAKLDDIRVYPAALNDAQIAALYQVR
jgi:hypothetical protein